jgi:hypothetical protein
MVMAVSLLLIYVKGCRSSVESGSHALAPPLDSSRRSIQFFFAGSRQTI